MSRKTQCGKVNEWERIEEGQKRKTGKEPGKGVFCRKSDSKPKAYEEKRTPNSALEFKILGTWVFIYKLIYFWLHMLKYDLSASFLFKKNLPLVCNTLLCTWTFVRSVDLMWSVLTTKTKPKQANKKRNTRRLWEMMSMSTTLNMIMVSLLHIYVQIHQIISVNYVQCLCINYASNKAGKNHFISTNMHGEIGFKVTCQNENSGYLWRGDCGYFNLSGVCMLYFHIFCQGCAL